MTFSVFDNLDTGKRLGDGEFDERKQPLRRQLLDEQFALLSRDYPVLIVLGGVPGSGKGALIHRLNQWMDPRGIDTNTFWQSSDEEESRPYFWRYWRSLPRRGQIGIFLGSWYTDVTQSAVEGGLDAAALDRYCHRINAFEETLTDSGALIIKLWLHVSRSFQRRQLEERAGRQQHPRVTDRPYELHGQYIHASPWQLIAAEDRHYRDITAGEIVLRAMRSHAARPPGQSSTTPAGDTAGRATVLDTVDLSATLRREDYKKQLAEHQAQLQDLAWAAYREGRSLIAVFEGWDAAGKGSAIRRVTRAIDPRLFHVTQTDAPTDEERNHHYLWRFWRQLQRDGRVTIFDRSWYGRVLVERVEGFAAEDEWRRAYREINQFESELVEHGCVLVKFWLHISADEQLARFREREREAHKRHKITEDDWRNRERWQDYALAVDEMIQRTDTRHSPWILIAGNDKRHARVQILQNCCTALEQGLED